MAALSRSVKRWWKLNRELLQKRAKVTSISPLRDEAVWITDSKQKANLFAKTFASKAKLPDEEIDCPFFGNCETELDGFLCIRTRNTLKILRKLNESTATGNDKIPAKILKRIALVIAAAFSQICRRLFDDGCWPQRWRLHLICPIYKKKSAFKPGNYRGVHLTTILSKLAERVIGSCLVKFLQQGKDAFTVDGQIEQRVRIDDESDAATASSPESLPVRHDSTPFRTHHQRTAASLHPLEQRPVNLTFALC